ncbi:MULTISPECIES: TetR/AcrR family transcriptional regulator [unclassified Aeromicrobium]|uniref:TetR/AcrR family transcriptional regulator n=1 Tax=unclassified Aeromicrobium TaxID=2633570 RepID=UPI0028899989|nr:MULTISPECIES: TetR/AcrR family transcriptional regulator [unclassified Aeromicrobium]
MTIKPTLQMVLMSYVSASVRRQQIVEAARRVMARDGVADASLRSVAAEAGVPLGTMQHVFKSKRQLLQAVIDDVNAEIADILGRSPQTDGGLAQVIGRNLRTFWADLVQGHSSLQLMQYELTAYALRSADSERLAGWQYRQYADGVAAWCKQAAARAGESTGVQFDQLARIIVAGLDGLILQHLCDPDDTRSARDLETFIEMVIALAQVGPVARTSEADRAH